MFAFFKEYGPARKVIDCIEHQEYNLKQLPIAFTNGTEVCLMECFNKAVDSLNVIISEVNQTESEVKAVTKELYKCNHSATMKMCVLQVEYNLQIILDNFELIRKSLPAMICKHFLCRSSTSLEQQYRSCP